MRIIVFSDTHGRIHRCIDIIDCIQGIDMIIHLGDILRDAEDLKLLYPHILIEYVAGNNEFNHSVPYDKLLELEGNRIFITHGHLYRVKYEYHTIINRGREMKADYVLFGHTHEEYEAYSNGIHIMNPGSISLSKSGKASYGVIEIEKGRMKTCICTV